MSFFVFVCLKCPAITFSYQSFLTAQAKGHLHLSQDPGRSRLLICLLKSPILVSQNHPPQRVGAFLSKQCWVGEFSWPLGMRKGQILLVERDLTRTGLEAAQDCKKNTQKIIKNCPFSMLSGLTSLSDAKSYLRTTQNELFYSLGQSIFPSKQNSGRLSKYFWNNTGKI